MNFSICQSYAHAQNYYDYIQIAMFKLQSPSVRDDKNEKLPKCGFQTVECSALKLEVFASVFCI